MQYYHGLGDFIEKVVEQLHQFTKRHKQIMGKLSDFQKESNAIAKIKHIESNFLAMVKIPQIVELTKSKNKSENKTLHKRKKRDQSKS